MVSLPLFHICWALPTSAERKACDKFFVDVFGAQTGFEHVYFVLPRDETLGMRIEFLKVELPGDPRPRAEWRAEWWRDSHPLGIEGLQSVGVSVDALDQGRALFADKPGWPEIALRSLPGDLARCAAFSAGDVIIEAMEPIREDVPLARHRREAQGMYCLTFKVRSAARAAEYLESKAFRLVGDVRDRFAIDPDQAFGRLMYFSENDPAGYPTVGSMIPGWVPERSFIPGAEQTP